MTAPETAQAYSRLYEICSQLYLKGIHADLLPLVQAVPDLARSLPAPLEMDQCAAAHQALFGFHLLPYESLLLDATGLLGGAVSEAVATTYQELGYVTSQTSGAPDHLGEELGLLAFLCGAEADAWTDGKASIARRLQQAQMHFLQHHLLRWLAPVTVAIRHHEDDFFREVAELTQTLVGEQYSALHEQGFGTEVTFVLPSAPPLLANEQTTIKDIAEYLTTPPYSGLCLTRYLINQLGRQYRLPRGFGSRSQMLTNLLRSAAQYDALPALLAELSAQLEAWAGDYEMIYATLPALTPFVVPWQTRIRETVALLQQLQSQASALLSADNEPPQ